MVNSWKEKNILKVQDDRDFKEIKNIDVSESKERVEPWLTALFQSEQFSLLLGSGISSATHYLANNTLGAGMGKIKFSVFAEQMEGFVKKASNELGRGDGNIEDQIRVANDLFRGLEIYISSNGYGSKKLMKQLNKFGQELDAGLLKFLIDVLQAEKNIVTASDTDAAEYLMNFLISFASRSGTRERLNIFTTNYDRIIEFGAELAGIRLIDRFVGTVNPIFRSSRLNIDMHYNPPGIRGEPRYLEGLAHFTKLHGSLDWYYSNDIVRKISVPFGADNLEAYFPKLEDKVNSVQSVMIYPNSSKDRETSEYPYVELFRDLASAVCRPNSTLIAYGYGFGDEHINRVIKDMITIPSSHLVIISYGDDGDRIQKFYHELKRPAQISLLIGNHFGDLKVLVDNYLPKPAIDRTTFKMVELLKSRGYHPEEKKTEDIKE
ncbi:MAG: SIR2 family protein [Candidatus Omnitrophica bacterium]|nr:SIR2 family protein [Candidatus Omnitrophota bacterium]